MLLNIHKYRFSFLIQLAEIELLEKIIFLLDLIEMDSNMTLSEIVSKNYHTAVIFKKYKMDFCCGGKKTLQEVCQEKNINENVILDELDDSNFIMNSQDNYSEWDIRFLIDYIINTQHSYVRKNLPIIKQFLNKTVSKHSTNHPELLKILTYFNQAEQELIPHMQKEEQILFPYIKSLVEKKESSKNIQAPIFGTVRNPIAMMEKEHEQAGELFRNIRSISNDLLAPSNACNTYQVTYSMLNEFEENLHFHIHLENNILFPKAIDLENEILI